MQSGHNDNQLNNLSSYLVHTYTAKNLYDLIIFYSRISVYIQKIALHRVRTCKLLLNAHAQLFFFISNFEDYVTLEEIQVSIIGEGSDTCKLSPGNNSVSKSAIYPLI